MYWKDENKNKEKETEKGPFFKKKLLDFDIESSNLAHLCSSVADDHRAVVGEDGQLEVEGRAAAAVGVGDWQESYSALFP